MQQGIVRIREVFRSNNKQVKQRKSHAITLSEIFKERDFLWDKERKIRSWWSGLARNQDFAKGEGLEPQVKSFDFFNKTDFEQYLFKS